MGQISSLLMIGSLIAEYKVNDKKKLLHSFTFTKQAINYYKNKR